MPDSLILVTGFIPQTDRLIRSRDRRFLLDILSREIIPLMTLTSFISPACILGCDKRFVIELAVENRIDQQEPT